MSRSLVIQAGGESRRMGQNKALMKFRGVSLVQRVAARMKPAADEVLVITNTPDDFRFLNLPLISDLVVGKGALGGLYTALKCANHQFVAVVACDMPFASLALLQAEFSLLEQADVDVVLPVAGHGPEPLHAVYRREVCLYPVLLALEENRLRLTSWMDKVRVREMSLEEIRAFDPMGRAFLNTNTPEEFAQAETEAEED
jgi:molybdopterin-guanine dinucleotide biosynthesis protein A